jgi:signal transduction histidine kinase
MSIRNRLTLLFTAIVSILLGVFCVLLYVAAEQQRQTVFRNRLRAEALTAGHLLYGKKPISPLLYKLLDQNKLTVLPQEEIIIYNEANRLVYESGQDYLTVTPAILNRVRREGEVEWQEADREILGIVYPDNPRQLVLFASAIDTFGINNQQSLVRLLSIGWGLMTLLMLAAGRFFAGRALQPINQINQQIDTITASQLSLRLPEQQEADELAQLAQHFNRMLDRLEDAFRMQRAFISHASHELRTPLTAITGQLDVALLANDDRDELRATVRSVLDDVRELNRLTNGLLTLTHASMNESAVLMGPVQIDNLLEQVKVEIQRLQPTFVIQLILSPPPDPRVGWRVTGSEALLQTALFNLMDNGGKYSLDRSVTVNLSKQGQMAKLSFRNGGAPIPADQLETIFLPFQRGRNAAGEQGHGIGLPLTQRIISLHHGHITVESSPEKATTFTVTLPLFV